MNIDLSNVIALALGSDDVLEIQDAVGTVLWQKTIYYNVNISAGSNGTVSVNGVSGDYSQSVPSGTVLTIEGTGNTGYNFNEWSDGSTTNPRTITVTGDLTLTASFASAVLPNYFYMENTDSSDIEMSITDNIGYGYDIYKSEDQENWTLLGNTDDFLLTATIPANSKLYLKCVGDSWDMITIKASGNHNVGGNIMSLLYGDNFENQTSFPSGSRQNFRELFSDDIELISAANLILPAITLADYCYQTMFQNCTSLTTAPVLSAITLTQGCYYEMFKNCSSLNSVTTYATDISANICLQNWLNGVASTGTFYNMACTTYPSGSSGIPTGWTELHTLNDTINVTITNTGNYSGATYQIDSDTAQPINETGTTSFAVPVTATTLTIHRNGKGVTEVGGICGIYSDTDWDAAFPVGKMTDNVSIGIMSLM